MVVIASPAARAKERGPRRQVQRSDVVEAAVKRRQQQRARKQADSVSKARLAGEADKQSRGRLRLHGPRDVVVPEDDQRRSLSEKKQRRTVHVHAVMASGASDFEAAPGRELFGDDEAGAEEQERLFNEYVDGNFDDAGAEVRTLDQRDRKVGLFGDWMEAVGHGKYIQWVKDEVTSLWKLEAVRDVGGAPLVPRTVAVMEFALRAARGDKRVPKGGRPEYRDGKWYKTVHGKGQGERMRSAKKNAFGQGPYSASKYKFTTLEQYVSAVAKFYDEVCRSIVAVVASVRGPHRGWMREWLTDGNVCTHVAGAQGHGDRQPSAQSAAEEGAEDDGAEDWARPAALASNDAGERASAVSAVKYR